MEKKEIQNFFDRLAPNWDLKERKHLKSTEDILDLAEIRGPLSVLDVACGTGVLIPYYIERGLKTIWGVDLSPEMIKAANLKFDAPNINFFAADAESFRPEMSFDRIMIFNAFPHFPNPDRLIENLSALLNPGGIITVAHSMSRAVIDEHHRNEASNVSRNLLPGTELSALMGRFLRPSLCIDDDTRYVVSAVKD